jgi:hypothetical protein
MNWEYSLKSVLISVNAEHVHTTRPFPACFDMIKSLNVISKNPFTSLELDTHGNQPYEPCNHIPRQSLVPLSTISLGSRAN